MSAWTGGMSVEAPVDVPSGLDSPRRDLSVNVPVQRVCSANAPLKESENIVDTVRGLSKLTQSLQDQLGRHRSEIFTLAASVRDLECRLTTGLGSMQDQIAKLKDEMDGRQDNALSAIVEEKVAAQIDALRSELTQSVPVKTEPSIPCLYADLKSDECTSPDATLPPMDSAQEQAFSREFLPSDDWTASPRTIARELSDGPPSSKAQAEEAVQPLAEVKDEQETTPACSSAPEPEAMQACSFADVEKEKAICCGDLVVLGRGAPEEYRDCPSVVTKVAESHCTVVVLDSTQQFGIGECWPSFLDVCVESCKLRVGTQVVIDGMSGVQTKHLNGLSGVITEHPKEGHPAFIRRSACPDKPQLVVCVRFNDPAAAKGKSALLQPRFLKSLDEVTLQALQATACLEQATPVA